MARIIRLAFFALAAMIAVYASAQTTTQPGRGTQQPEPQPPRPTPQRGNKDSTFAVSGCLKSSVTPGGFILTNAWPVTEPDGGRQSTPSVGTTQATAGSTYALISTAGDDLAKYVNQKVEVSGMLGPAPDAPTSATSSSRGGQSLVTPAGSITVQTVKMVSTTCN